jgi:transposase
MQQYAKPKDILNYEFLYEKYILEGKSVQEIAKIANLKSSNSVTQALHRLRIHKREHKNYTKILTKEFLEDCYIYKNMSQTKIAKMVGTNKIMVRRYLNKHNIPIRECSLNDENGNKFDTKSSRKRLNTKLSILTKDFLEENYVLKKRTMLDIAKEVGCSYNLVSKQLKKFNLHNKDLLYGAKKTWKGYGEISGRYFTQLKTNAAEKGYEFNITIEYIWDLYIRQEGKCALSGIQLQFVPIGKCSSNCSDQTASLDRIDSQLGYIEGNLQWVHKHINWMKQHFSNERFIELCIMVGEHNKK